MKRIKTDLPDGMVTDIDFERGSVPRSAYIRDVLSKHLYPDLHDPAKVATGVSTRVSASEADAPKHRHRFETNLDERFVKGVKQTLSSCACGAERWSS